MPEIPHIRAAALFAALLLLTGCGKPVPQEASLPPAPEAASSASPKTPASEPVSEPASEPAPEPEPAPLPAGQEVLLFGARTPTRADGDTLYVDAEALAGAAGLHAFFDASRITLTQTTSESFPVARADELDAGEGFLQEGAAYVPLLEAAARFGFVTGTAIDGTPYLAKTAAHSAPTENVNVPVLMYHAVSDDVWGYRDLFVSPQTMEEELLYLQENGYETIWFSDLSHLEDYEKPVILTFDDGYDDNYTELFPLLQKYNAKATIFVIPKYIGAEHKMTAAQVQELARSGLVSIQSHTYSHGNLSTMDEETLIYEMQESQNYLAALTGHVPYVVCYPEGTRSELSIEVAGRYYDYGLLMNGQLYNTSDDPMRVKRFYIPRGYDLGSFKWSIEQAGTSRK